MTRASLAAALLLAVAGVATAASDGPLYRIELRGGGAVLSEEAPKQNGASLLFKLYPRGTLMSVRSTDVARVVAVPRKPGAPATAGLKPGGQMVLGATGSGGGGARAAEAGGRAAGGPTLRPGEGQDGTALFNPDRAYRPEWDSRRVPGLNMPYPASPNDYREGRTLAYPPASAIQTAPGQPPMMPPSSGEPPKAPN